MLSVSIRQIDESDWKIYRDLRLKALKSDPLVFGSNFELESKYTEEKWREWIGAENCAIFLLFNGESTIGMTGIYISDKESDKNTAFLWGSWLEPDFRRKGLSDLMYENRIESFEKVSGLSYFAKFGYFK